jgi:hypothetical protein
MLDNLKYEEYVSALNTKFQLTEISVDIELIEVTPRKTTTNQVMFSLIFSGPKDNFLEQRIYEMHHEHLGDGGLFIVPIAEKKDAFHYEASFNMLIT